MLLEKLLLATYRRLFRKVAIIHAELNPAKASQVKAMSEGSSRGIRGWKDL